MSASTTLIRRRFRQPVPGNRVKLLQGGDEFFPAVVKAIQSSHSQIYLETYIYHDDAGTRPITEALTAAAKRGVKVRVMVDGFGSDGCLTPALVDRLRAAGVNLRIYRPYRFWRLLGDGIRRSHRKLILIDERLAFVGGINLLDDHHDPRLGELSSPRFDFAVALEGPIVWTIGLTMRRLWWFTGQTDSTASKRRDRLREAWREWLKQAPPDPVPDGVPVSFVRRGHLRPRHAIERAYLEAIRNAREDIVIASAYFAPGRKFRQALCAAARRGARVRLLLQGQREYWAQRWSAQALYDGLLCHGVEIYEYMPSLLHAKVAVIDQRWATVGSSNLDPFSLLLAREANVIVHDSDFSQELHAALMNAIDVHAQRIPPDAHRHRHWCWRAFHALGRGLIRAFAYFSGRRDDY